MKRKADRTKPVAALADSALTLELLRVIARALLSPVIERELSNKRVAQVYEMTGQATRPEIEKKSGFSGGKISGLWIRWERLGLLVKDGKSYRKSF